ncbi:MAG: hypothetical protein PQJ50_16795 [Spirochaetales bacterium]|nr:hypothetical protein [Spirochaetales bacterium]
MKDPMNPLISPPGCLKFIILFISLIAGCRLISLKHLSYFTVNPGQDYGILSDDDEISVSFTEPVDPVSVESILYLESQKGKTEFHPRWENDRKIIIRPLSHMEVGLQYRLEFQGIYTSAEGDEREADLSRPFYYLNSSYEPFQLMGTVPDYGVPLAPSDEIQLLFTDPVDENSISRGITVSPSADYTAHCLDSTVILTPTEEEWDNLSSYTISLSNELKSVSGTELYPEDEFFFSVETETFNPSVTRIGSCGRERLEGFPWTGTTLSNLQTDSAIRIGFSDSMDHDSAESALSFSPSLPGEYYWLETDLIFCPAMPFYSGQEFRLTLKTEASGSTGIPLDREYTWDFSPDIAPLEVLTIQCSSGEGLSLTEYSDDTYSDLPRSELPDYELCFHITFSRPLESAGEKQFIQDILRFYEVFTTGAGITAELFSWTGDYRLTVIYSGFSPADEHYYILEIPGGERGAVNAEGSRMEEDLRQLFRTASE